MYVDSYAVTQTSFKSNNARGALVSPISVTLDLAISYEKGESAVVTPCCSGIFKRRETAVSAV